MYVSLNIFQEFIVRNFSSPEVLNSQCSESTYGVEVDYWSVGVILYEMLYGEPAFYTEHLISTYARIQNFATELKFPTDVELSPSTKDIIKRFLSAANVRLGAKGAAEVRAHPFFKNDQWTFETIRNGTSIRRREVFYKQWPSCQFRVTATPPFVPKLSADDDTSNFEEITAADANSGESFQIPKAFNGTNLSFIGFTYANECSPALALSVRADEEQKADVTSAPVTAVVRPSSSQMTQTSVRELATSLTQTSERETTHIHTQTAVREEPRTLKPRETACTHTQTDTHENAVMAAVEAHEKTLNGIARDKANNVHPQSNGVPKAVSGKMTEVRFSHTRYLLYSSLLCL